MYVYMYVFMYSCMYVHKYVLTYAFVYVCMYGWTDGWMDEWMDACILHRVFIIKLQRLLLLYSLLECVSDALKNLSYAVRAELRVDSFSE